MIPTAAMKSGTLSVDEIEPNARVRGPAHDEHEDQPHVVGLPDRAHRVVGEVAHRRRRAGPGQQVPEARAEVGAAQHHVGGEADSGATGASVTRLRSGRASACLERARASRRRIQATAPTQPG